MSPYPATYTTHSLLAPTVASNAASAASSATAAASSLLSDFRYSASMQRVLDEKDAAYEQLLAQHRKLKEQKKAELGTLVDGAAAAAEQHVRSGAAMVAHWKQECAAAAAAAAAEHLAVEATQVKLRAQEEETQQYIDRSKLLEKELEDSKRQCQYQESSSTGYCK